MIRNKSYIFLVDRSINNKKRTENFCNIDAVSVLIWLIPGTTKKKIFISFLNELCENCSQGMQCFTILMFTKYCTQVNTKVTDREQNS